MYGNLHTNLWIVWNGNGFCTFIVQVTLLMSFVVICIIKRVMSIYLSVCLYVANGRPNGWADQDQTWHRDSC